MNMTTAQLQAFKAAIAANTNTVTFDGQTVAINAVPIRNEDGANAIAAFYNQLAAGPFFIFNTAVPLSLIANSVLWKSYTPAPAPDTTVLYTNVCNACQCDQISIQNLFLSLAGSAFDASLKNLRQGLKDCTSAVPSGTPVGTAQDAGWTTSFSAIPGPLVRSATIFESAFAVATTGPLGGGSGALGSGGAQGVANVAVPATDALGGYVQGSVTFQDVFNAWGS